MGLKMQQHFSQMAALGRPFQLGDLYDYHTDNILTECRLGWDLPSAIQVDGVFILKIYTVCTTVESWNKWEHMDLDQHLQASTVAGLIVPVKGASRYLSHRANPAEASQTLVCRTISRTDRLDLTALLNNNVPSIPADGTFPNATHVVVGVLYGAEIYCVIAQDIQDEDARQETEEKLSKISIKMENALENNQDVAEFKQLLEKEEKLLIGRLKCRLYADLQAQPVGECSIFEAYKRCLRLIEKFKITDTAVPVSVLLCPVKSIVDPSGALLEYRDVDGDLVIRLCRIWNELERIGAKVDAICKKADLDSLRQFGEVVVKIQERLQCSWKRRIVKARRSKDGDKDVERAVHFAELHPIFKASKLNLWLNYKKTELEMVGKMESIDGVHLLAGKWELEKELAETLDGKFSLVLTVPPLDEQTNEMLQVMKNHVDNFTLPIEEEENEKLPWYLIRRKRKQWLDKLLEFSHFVEKNKHLKNRVQFFIIFGETGKKFGYKYSVYQSGNLMLDNLRQLPGPPTGLRIRFHTPGNKSIRLLWDYEDCGWPCHFVVQYRLKGQLDDSWKQQKTLKLSETQTDVKFANGSVFEIRVAAETCVGLGDFSDIIDSDFGFEETYLQPPTDIKLKLVTETTAEFGWSPSTGSVSSYRIRYWQNGQPSSVREIDSNGTNVIFKHLQSGATYSVNISATEDGRESGPSETIEFTTLDSLPWYESCHIPLGFIYAVSEEFIECADKLLARLTPIDISMVRLLFVSILFMDAISISLLWYKNGRDLDISWATKFLIAKFVIGNLLGKLAGSLAILLRWDVCIGCGLLLGFVCLQEFMRVFVWDGLMGPNNPFWMSVFLILLIFAEDKLNWKSYLTSKLAGHCGDQPKISYTHSACRFLLLLTYVTFLRMESSLFIVGQNVVASVLMLFTTTGYKANLSAWILVAWLNLFNIYLWPWWTIFAHHLLIYHNFVMDKVYADRLKESKQTIIKMVEGWTNEALRSAKRFLPTVIRLCAVFTFIHDGFHIVIHSWDEKIEYLVRGNSKCRLFLFAMLICINVMAQLAGSIMILLRWKVGIACAILFGVIGLQFIMWINASSILLCRYFGTFGVLLLVLAETRQNGDKFKQYLFLTGRILLLLFVSHNVIVSEIEFFNYSIFLYIGGAAGTMLLLDAIGYKTKLLLAICLAIFLLFINLNYWWIPSEANDMMDNIEYGNSFR